MLQPLRLERRWRLSISLNTVKKRPKGKQRTYLNEIRLRLPVIGRGTDAQWAIGCHVLLCLWNAVESGVKVSHGADARLKNVYFGVPGRERDERVVLLCHLFRRLRPLTYCLSIILDADIKIADGLVQTVLNGVSLISHVTYLQGNWH